MDIKSILKDQKYQFVLQGLYKGTIKQISQQAEGNSTPNYPELYEKLGMSPEYSHTIINGLFDQELLQRKPKGQTFVCPKDDSMKIHIQLYCSKCSSNNVAKTNLIEHYKCGNIDSQNNYNKGQELVCPKCNKTLNQIGVNYKKMSAYICRKCGNRMSTPHLRFECTDFGHNFDLTEASMKELYTYTLTDEARKKLDKELFNFIPLIKYFEDLDFKVKNPFIIIGFSGNRYSFDILGLKKSGEKRESLLLKLVPADHSIQLEEVQMIFAEIMDTQPDYTIIVAIPNSSDKAKYFAELNRITIVDGKNADEIVQKLIESKWTDKKIRYSGGEKQ